MAKEILYEGKYLRFINDDTWEYVQRYSCTGIVIILALTPDSKVLFVEQYRHPVQQNVIEFPAGLVNDRKNKRKESNETAAKRELLEETGYEAKKIAHVFTGPASPGLCAEQVSFYEASDLKRRTKGGGDATENIIVHEVPFKKAHEWLLKMKKKGKLVDAKIFSGLYFLEKRLSASSKKISASRVRTS